MPLFHLIALIINAHPARQRYRSRVRLKDSATGRSLIRKTSLLRDRSDGERSGSTDVGVRNRPRGLPMTDARIDLLFTMSDNNASACLLGKADSY